MLVLDALFDHFQQISSNVEIIGSLVPNKHCCGRATTRRRHSVCKGGAPPGCRKKFTPRFFAGGLFFFRNFSSPSLGERGGVAPRCAIPRRRGCASASSIGHLQNFQRLRAPLRARLRSPRATLAETARIRHLIEINRALGRTSPVSVRITCFPTV